MATHTTYYNLTKPSQNDKVNIGVLNDNADIIDTALHHKVDSDDLTANNVMMSDNVTSVEDALDEISEVVVKQTTGTSITLNTRCTLYYDGENYYGFIVFPFVAKKTNYTVQIKTASQDNVGNVLGNTTVVQKLITGFNLKITGAYGYTKCGLGIGYTITFA